MQVVAGEDYGKQKRKSTWHFISYGGLLIDINSRTPATK